MAHQIKSVTDRGPVIQVTSGAPFYPFTPRPDEIKITDIANSLSYLCRYNGHVKKFYSVAEHSFHLSNVVEPEYALEALLHDAAEAYVGDLVAPIKRHIPEFNKIETQIMRAIWYKFGLPNRPLPIAVRDADQRIMLDERKYVLNESRFQWPLAATVRTRAGIKCWTPKTSREKFLERFHELTEHRFGEL